MTGDDRTAGRRPRRRAPLRRRATWAIEGALAWGVYHAVRLLPLDAASALGGGVLRLIGPRMGASRRARAQIARALPEASRTEIDRIVRGMWDNLGRVVVEYALLDRLARATERDPSRIVITGLEHAQPLIDQGRPVVIATAHMANWEAAAIAARMRHVPLAAIYRPPNNPHVDRLVKRARAGLGTRLIEKRMEGPGSVRALGALREGLALATLCDQHFTGGVEVPFFGRPAATSPAPVKLARHVGGVILPIHVERVRGARFRVVIDPPLEIPETGDADADAAAATAALTRQVEGWVRAHPEQWLWLHRRWKSAERRGQ